MSCDLESASIILDREFSGEEQRLITDLDRWGKRVPTLPRPLVALGRIESMRQRRGSFWQLLAEQEHAERTRTMTSVLASAYREEKEGLRLLFTFLCGRPTTFLYPEQAASLRHTWRLGKRLLYTQAPLEDQETQWAGELRDLLPADTPLAQLRAILAERGAALRKLLSLEDHMPHPFPADLGRHLELEGRAASLRGGRIVEKAGDYNPAAMAKLLPMVVALDEWNGDLTALADKGAKALKHPLKQFLDSDSRAWQRTLSAEGVVEPALLRWIQWMETTELVGSEPAAWVSLLQTLGQRQYQKILHAVMVLPQRWRRGRLGMKSPPPAELIPKRALNFAEGCYWVELDELLWSHWVSPDGLPMSPELWRQEDCPLLMLRSRIQDDAFCEMILGNEQWSSRHGVVEAIARGSRSLKTLLLIARSRRLHTGTSNRAVPLALLENPCNLPVSALRPFFSLRYISRHDLTRLSRGNADVREEISREARAVLRHL